MNVGVRTMRHSAVTAVTESGVHIKAVADPLGYSSIAITGDFYGHTSVDTARAAVDGLGTALGFEPLFDLVWVQGLGTAMKRAVPEVRKPPLTSVRLTGPAGATASYLGGRFGSQHHVALRSTMARPAYAGPGHCFCVGLTGFEPATT